MVGLCAADATECAAHIHFGPRAKEKPKPGSPRARAKGRSKTDPVRRDILRSKSNAEARGRGTSPHCQATAARRHVERPSACSFASQNSSDG